MKERNRFQRIVACMTAFCMLVGSWLTPIGVYAEGETTAEWKVIQGQASRLTVDAQKPQDVTLKDYVTGYYNQKIDVVDGTEISIDVQLSQISDSVLLYYGFALVDSANSFYQSNTTANSLMVELNSNAVAGDKAPQINAFASKKVSAATTRNWLANLYAPLATDRNTADVYKITYKKINETVDNINYSWELIVDKAGVAQTYKVKATDIAHNLFQNGAYLAAGSMSGSSPHTVNITNLTVKQPGTGEPEVPEVTAGWQHIHGQADRITADPEDAKSATMTGFVSGYYNQKIAVEEGTKISFDVNFSSISDNVGLHYGFALVDRAGSFYDSDTSLNSIMIELQSTANATDAAPTLNAVASKKMAAGNRAWLANLYPSLAKDRNTTDVYTFTYTKINKTIDNVNYSWELTVQKGEDSQTYMVKASDIAHDLFKDGAYLAAGRMTSASPHTVNITNLTVEVVEPEEPEQPQEPAGWQVIAGQPNRLTTDADNEKNATLTDYVTAYYNEKIAAETGTEISFDVNLSEIGAGQKFHYGFALVDSNGQFYQSSTTLNSMMVELQSTSETAGKWPLNAIASKKLSGGARVWIANVLNLTTDRNTTDVYTITFTKVDKTDDGVNYSWKMTVQSGVAKQSYMVKASDISHDLFKDGVYVAAGSMMGSSPHTVKITNLTVGMADPNEDQEDNSTGWKVVAQGSSGAIVEDAKDALFKDYVTGYYSEKIDVERGTEISYNINLAQITDGEGLHYAFALMNKKGCFFTSDMSASALMMEFQSTKEVNGKWPLNIVASKKLNGGGRNWVANFPVLTDGMNTSDVYKITYKKIDETVRGVNYSWKITIQNGNRVAVYGMKASDVPHDMFSNGAYVAMGSVKSVCTHDVKITGLTYKKTSTANDAEGLVSMDDIWKIVRGYGKGDINTGFGVSQVGNKVVMQGFGGLAYMEKAVTNAVSIDFEMDNFGPKNDQFYSFGVVNKKGVYYNPNGSESQGVYVRLRLAGEKLNVQVYTVSESGSEYIGDLYTTVKPTNTKHTLTFFKDGDNWCVAIDGQQKIKINEKVNLGVTSYLCAGASTIKELKMVVSKVSIDSEVTDAMKAGDTVFGAKVGGFQIVRGYGRGGDTTGTGLSLSGNKVVMQGFGGLAYVEKAVTNAVAVDFDLGSFGPKNDQFYSFGLVNKKGVYYNPNGSESQGIYVRLKPTGDKLNVQVYTLTDKGSEYLGDLYSTIKPSNTKHTITFFKEGGQWCVGIDGQQKLKINEKVFLGELSYLCAGASAIKELSMSVSKVYIDGQVTSAMKGGKLVAGAKVGGFQIVRGYGKGGDTTGDGLAQKDDMVLMQGYGGVAYVEKSVSDAVAVEFELVSYDKASSHFFSFGLVNKKGVYYNPNGLESQGIFVRIKSWGNERGLNVQVFTVTQAGIESLGSIVTNKPARDFKHTLSFYKEEGKWYVAIDEYQKMRLDVDVDLSNESYLCAGAASTRDLVMGVSKVYIDGQVTEGMRAGSLILSSVSLTESGGNTGIGGTSFDLTKDLGTFNVSAKTMGPANVLVKMIQSLAWYQYVLIGVAAIGMIGTGATVILGKKKKKEV